MRTIARALIAGAIVIASARAVDAIPCVTIEGYDCPQFPPGRALPDVLYFIGAERNNYDSNEFGHKYWPEDPASADVPKKNLPITDWQGITSEHSRWNARSGHPGYSYWFRVEHGRRTSGTSGEKSEVALPFSIGPGQDFYFGISVLMETASVSKWNLFFQLHSSMVLGSMVGLDTHPAMWNNVMQSALGVHYQSGDGTGLTCPSQLGAVCPAHGPDGQGIQVFTKFADINLGKWNDIILHVKMSSYTSDRRLNSDGMLQVWHRLAGATWTDPVVSQTRIFLGVTYTPKGMVADTYPRAGLYRGTWCESLAVGNVNCQLAVGYVTPQPTEEIYLDNIVVARTLKGAKSVFPATDTGR